MPSSPRLLLLEDDPAIAHTVRYALGREGLLVDHVSWVREARERLAAADHGYAALILDVGLPDGSGLDLCRDLRLHQGLTLPIVLLTARDEELDRVLGLELGADDYLCKPFSPRELCARLRALLRRAAWPAEAPAAAVAAAAAPAAATSAARDGAPPAPQAHGAADVDKGAADRDLARVLVFDADGQRVRCAGQWLNLTRRELGLLQTLHRWPGRIWSREALLDAVWGGEVESADRTVDTHIKTLRAKLREAGGAEDLILTHRGLGYSLATG